MRPMLFVLLILATGGSAHAQTNGPQVDQAEVLRLGNMVQVVGDGLRASHDADAYVAAMGPPASDADKWFISVVTMRNCPGCVKLKRDWQATPSLLALANPTDPKQSWAHYNVYDKGDLSQSFRFQGVKITAYPTILVQPPRSGRYGDPATVVYQGVYSGDAEKLARDILQAIRKYVAKLPVPRAAREPGHAGPGVGADPPWCPAPKVDPFQPQPLPQPAPLFPPYDPTIPPQPPTPAPTPAPAFSWSSAGALAAAGFSLPAAAGLVAWSIYAIRAKRLAAGKQPVVDQAALDRVLELLKKLAENPSKASASGN